MVSGVQLLKATKEAVPGRGCSLLSACVRAFQGVSPALMEELCTVAEVDSSAQPTQLSDSQWHRLFSAWQHWLDVLASGKFQPAFDAHSGRLSVLDSRGEPCEGDVHAAVEHLFQSSQACSAYSHSMYRPCMLPLICRTGSQLALHFCRARSSFTFRSSSCKRRQHRQ